MWNINFKTYQDNELQEEGFEASFAHDLNHVIQEVDTLLDLENIDKIELSINKINAICVKKNGETYQAGKRTTK